MNRFLLSHAPALLLLAVFAIFGILAPSFFEYQSAENILKQASYIGIVAIGMTVVLLTAGIDLSVGANMYLSASAAGLLMSQTGAPVPVALAACVGIGIVFGGVNALLITRLGVIPFIATLGTLVAGRGVGLALTRSQAVPYPDEVLSIGSTRLFGLVPMPIVIFGIVLLAAHLVLERTPLGRQIYAVGHDEEAARRAGIDTRRTLAVVYILCGALAALGGFVSVAQLGIVNAGFGEGDEFDAIAAAVLGGASLFGGRGSVFPGTLLGTVLIQTVAAGLIFTQVDLYVQPLVIASIIFLAVLIDGLRTRRMEELARRRIRVEAG